MSIDRRFSLVLLVLSFASVVEHNRAAHDPKITLKMQPDGTVTITHTDGTTETEPPIRQPSLLLA